MPLELIDLNGYDRSLTYYLGLYLNLNIQHDHVSVNGAKICQTAQMRYSGDRVLQGMSKRGCWIIESVAIVGMASEGGKPVFVHCAVMPTVYMSDHIEPYWISRYEPLR